MTTTVQVTTNPITVLPVSEQTGATYTFTLADRLRVTKGNRETAQVFTVAPDSEVDHPDGSILTVCQAGVGQITIAAGSGVTIRSADSALKLRRQYSVVQLWKETTNVWWAFGDVVA